MILILKWQDNTKKTMRNQLNFKHWLVWLTVNDNIWTHSSPVDTFFCSVHVKAFIIVTKRSYYPGTCNICPIKAYFGPIWNGGNEEIDSKQHLLIYECILNQKVPALWTVTMKVFTMAKTIRAPRYHSWIILVLSSQPLISVWQFV